MQCYKKGKLSYMNNDKQFFKNFAILTFSIALQNLITYSVNLTDNMMLGAYSENALSGAALANQIQFFLQMLIAGIGEGIVILGVQYWGRKRLEPIKKIIVVGLWISMLGSGILFVIVICFPSQVLGLLTSDVEVINEGVKFLRIICFTYMIFAITYTLIASLRSVGVVKIGYIIPIFTLIINASLNYCLIYGNFGMPALGVQGSAIATLVSRIVELIIVLLFLKFHDHKFNLCLKEVIKVDFSYFKDYFHVAMPVIISNSLWGFALGVQTAILGHMGTEAISANSIAMILFQMTSVVSYGAASAAGMMTGKAVGEGDLEKIKRNTQTFQLLFIFIGIFTGLTIFLLRDFIIQFYTISDVSKALTKQFMTILAITSVGTSYQMATLTGIVRGGGDTKFPLINDMIFMWLIVIPSSALSAFYFHFTPIIVFACLKSDQILKCFVAVIKVNQYNWINQVIKIIQPG
ncbi:MAG: putative MATE family efflux protein [Clostridium sp.]|jgi:putative MATE family efflux protein